MELVGGRIDTFMSQRLAMDQATINDLRPRYWREYGTTLRGLMVEYGINPEAYLSFVHDLPISDLLASDPSVQAAVARLSWRKVIVTNSTRAHVDRVLQALGLQAQFERVFDIEDLQYVSKPDPTAYQLVLRSLGATAKECLLIDDSLANLQTAHELGMVTVHVGSAQAGLGVDWAIPTLAGIAEVEDKLDSGYESESEEVSTGHD